MIEAVPEPDILVNNNGGPPRRDFREIDRSAFLQGVVMNMATPVEMIGRVVDGMAERGFGRIVNITSVSVKMPVPGLDLSSGARAGLTAFVAGIVPTVAANNVTINNLLPGYFDTVRLRSIDIAAGAKAMSAATSPSSPNSKWLRFRPSASATRKSSARPAPSSAARKPATSRARTWSSTAAATAASGRRLLYAPPRA